MSNDIRNLFELEVEVPKLKALGLSHYEFLGINEDKNSMAVKFSNEGYLNIRICAISFSDLEELRYMNYFLKGSKGLSLKATKEDKVDKFLASKVPQPKELSADERTDMNNRISDLISLMNLGKDLNGEGSVVLQEPKDILGWLKEIFDSHKNTKDIRAFIATLFPLTPEIEEKEAWNKIVTRWEDSFGEKAYTRSLSYKNNDSDQVVSNNRKPHQNINSHGKTVGSKDPKTATLAWLYK